MPTSASSTNDQPTKTISWNCNVSSFRGTPNDTAVEEEVFDEAELEREFLDRGAFSYADFKNLRGRQQQQQQQSQSRDEGATTTTTTTTTIATNKAKLARAASTPNVIDNDASSFPSSWFHQQSNNNSANHHDSSGCFSIEAGELITSEFVMLKYKQASYNSNYDDSAELVVANENSKTEDGAWDVSGTFEYYHDEVSTTPTTITTATTTTTAPNSNGMSPVNNKEVVSPSISTHRPMGRRGSGRQVKRTSLKAINNPLQPVTETSETASSSTKTPSFHLDAFNGDDLKAFAAMSNYHYDDDADDDDDGNASTGTDFSDTDRLINFMANEAEESKRIADAQRARRQHPTHGIQPVEDSMSSLKDVRDDGYTIPSPLVTTVTSTVLDDSISTLGFNDDKITSNSINDSMSTLYNGTSVWKAKGGTIYPTCQDSISGIDISCVQGVMKDLNTNDESKEKAKEASLVKQDCIEMNGNAIDTGKNVNVQDVFEEVLSKQRGGTTSNNPVQNPFRNKTVATTKKEKNKTEMSSGYNGQRHQQQQTETIKGFSGSRHHQMNATKNLIERSIRRRCTMDDNGGNSSPSIFPSPGGMNQHAKAQSFKGSNVTRGNSIKGDIKGDIKGGSSLTKNQDRHPPRRRCTVDDAKAPTFDNFHRGNNSSKGGGMIGGFLDERRASTDSKDTISTSESDTLRSSAVRGRRINYHNKNTFERSGSEPEYYVQKVSSILYGDM